MDASNEPPMSDIDSHSQNLVNGSDINHLQYNGIRFDKLSSEDLKGKEFKNVEEADAFYYAYAKAMGFDVRSDYKRFSVRTKDRVTSRRLFCSAQGKRREEYMNSRKRVRMPKKETRFNCPCLFKVSYCKKKNSYIVDDFYLCMQYYSVNERLRIALTLLKYPHNLARIDINEAIEQDVQETCPIRAKKTKTIQEKDTPIKATNNMTDEKSCVIKKEKNNQLELKQPVQEMQRRGRGCPRGAKNKPKKGTTDA